MSKKPKVSVEVEQEAMDRYQAEATRRNITVSALTRLALDKMAPQGRSGSDEAWAEADRMEETAQAHPRRILPILPPANVEPMVRRAPAPAAGPGRHPCRFLRTRMPGNRRTGDGCQGTCSEQSRSGSACDWGPAVASQCGTYAARGGDA